MNKSVVQNFLITMPKQASIDENLRNAVSDARSFRWKKATLKAIVKGITLCYEDKKSFYQYIGGL